MSTVFEEKNISKAVIKLGLPAMLGQLATLIYNLADTYFVSLTKDANQIAAVTLCMPVLLIIMSIACIFGMGGSSVIARWLGEKNNDGAEKCLNFCTYAMLASGVVFMIAGLLAMTPTAYIIGADGNNFDFTCDYLKWIFIGTPFIMLANGLVHIFRSVGLIKQATVGLFIGNGMNILLDALFIVIMKMGTAGAALATSLGFLCAVVYYTVCMINQKKKGNKLINLSPGDFSPSREMVKAVIQIGIPGALITVLMSAANIVLNNFIGIYGSDAVASYGIAYKLDMFTVMLSVGLSQGVAPFIGYCYGAKKRKALSKAMKISTLYGIALGTAFMVFFFVTGTSCAKVFMHEPELVNRTVLFLKLLCIHGPILGIINMVTAYFQALGKAVNSLAITLLRNLVLFIPGVILMNKLLGLNGVILTQFAVEVVLTVICAVMYIMTSPQKLLK